MSGDETPHRECANLEEVEATVRDLSTGLQQSLIEEVGAFTVALLPISTAGTLERGATGTLVSFQGSHYILTAAHVAEKLKSQSTARVGITLKAENENHCLLDPSHMLPFGPRKRGDWNEWGPDITLLSIPSVDARRIEAEGRGVFHNLSLKQALPLGPGEYPQCRVLMGVPALLSNYRDAHHADLCLNGTILQVDKEAPHAREGFDYIDLDLNFHPAREDFGGVSGGGLWRILFCKDTPTGKLQSLKVLEGLAFYAIGDSKVRCHGPRSIGNVLNALFESRIL